MPRTLVFVVVILLTAVGLCAKQTAFAQAARAPVPPKTSGRDAKIIAMVRAVLDAQVAAWNRGDIEGFMDGYARSGSTVFVSGDTVTHGWQTVLDRYKKGYDSREKMGQLTFG